MNWLVWKELNSDFIVLTNPCNFASDTSLETCHEDTMVYLVSLSL